MGLGGGGGKRQGERERGVGLEERMKEKCYVIHKILQQHHFINYVLNYMCTKFGRNIVGEVCLNNVT